MHAQDAPYHRNYFTHLYRKAEQRKLGDRNYTDEGNIEEQIADAIDKIPVFKLSDLVKFYRKAIVDLGLTL